MHTFLTTFFLFSLARSAFAATAEQWRGRSIYQIITDRYALPEGADPTKCDPAQQTWCGGTWNTIRDNLDYIQDAGFTAIWISPVSQNYEGARSAYGDPYHGYWIQDATKLNSRFGTADDLKALSDELHKRDMYLMVDVVVNNVMATTVTPDYSKYMFKDPSKYHQYCAIQWGNHTSEEECWLGDEKVPLPDVDTEDPEVISAYQSWIKTLVDAYNIDGLRIDAAKHVNIDFWPKFCGAADVFCIGEVFGDDIDFAASYQGPKSLDSILNYPTYSALTEAFAIPGPGNMSALTNVIAQTKSKFKDPGLLGNFLENQDLPRWSNMSVDIQSLWNAMVFNFMSDGIPIVYYGQEQGFHGSADPMNREPMWPSKYANTSTYQLITKLNALRNWLINSTDSWLHSSTEVLTTSPHGISIMKGPIVSILTNIGSPPQNLSVAVYTPYPASMSTIDILSCTQFAIGSNGTVEAEYTRGGQAKILVPESILQNSGICGFNQEVQQQTKGQVVVDNGAFSNMAAPSQIFVLSILSVLGFAYSAIGL